MTKQADITWDNDRFYLIGDFDFNNAMSIYEKSLSLFGSVKDIHIDGCKIQSSDSVGLALILELKKYALNGGKNFQVTNLPESLISIAKAAGLTDLVISR